MDWKLFLMTFGLLFVAEIGDKTQLAVIALASENRNPLVVFLGATAALVLVTLIGVVVGQTLSHLLPPGAASQSGGGLVCRDRRPVVV